MKQSSIEWFAEKTFSPFITEEKYNEILLQAKEIHKEEIQNAFSSGEHQQGFEGEAEQYYNEIFNTKEK